MGVQQWVISRALDPAHSRRLLRALCAPSLPPRPPSAHFVRRQIPSLSFRFVHLLLGFWGNVSLSLQISNVRQSTTVVGDTHRFFLMYVPASLKPGDALVTTGEDRLPRLRIWGSEDVCLVFFRSAPGAQVRPVLDWDEGGW